MSLGLDASYIPASGGGSGSGSGVTDTHMIYRADVADETALAALTAGTGGTYAEGTLIRLADDSEWVVTAGTDAAVAGQVVHPANYNAITNAFVFVRRG